MPYTDQFDRRDPLTLNPLGLFDLWPRQAVFEARALLAEGRSADDLMAIAASVEHIILNEVARLLRLPVRPSDITVSGNPKAWRWPAALHPNAPQELRERHGDTNLYEAAIAHGQARLPTSIHFADWEGYGVIALWKLVDFMDALAAPRRRLIAAHRQADGLNVYDESDEYSRLFNAGIRVPKEDTLKAQIQAAPMLVEAVRACSLGAECRLRAAQLDALTSRAQRDRAWSIERIEMRRRQKVSEQAREAADASHEHLAVHQEKAWALANSRWFPSRAAAARYAAARISKSDGKAGGSADPEADDDCYKERTVAEWLKARGWNKQPKPPAPAAPKRRGN